MGIQPSGSFWGHIPHQPTTINIRLKKIHMIGITGDPWARGEFLSGGFHSKAGF
jgi:hypothetical protein